MPRKLALFAVLGTGTGLLASAASGVAGINGQLERAAATQQQQQHQLLEGVSFERSTTTSKPPCARDKPRDSRPASTATTDRDL